MKRFFYIIAAAALLLASCEREQETPAVRRGHSLSFSVKCADYSLSEEDGTCTRSIIGTDKTAADDGSQKITDWNIWVYDRQTGKLANTGSHPEYGDAMKSYFTTKSGIDGDLLFPDYDKAYDVFVLCNVGEITSIPQTRTDAQNYHYEFDSYEGFKPENGGFPMAVVESNVVPATREDRTFKAQRLVSKYHVVIVNDIPDSEFELTGVNLRTAATDIQPFADVSKIADASDALNELDRFNHLELERKSNGNYEGDLFMLENFQGNDVFKSGVTVDLDRLPANMVNKSHEDLCTALEFKGNINMYDGHGQSNITFRHYFGSGRTAGVLRNVNTTVTLTLTSCPTIEDENWRIVPDEEYDYRNVIFSEKTVQMSEGDWREITVIPVANGVENEYIRYHVDCQKNYGSSSLEFEGINFGQVYQGRHTFMVHHSSHNYIITTLKAYVEDVTYTGDRQPETCVIETEQFAVPHPDQSVFLCDRSVSIIKGFPGRIRVNHKPGVGYSMECVTGQPVGSLNPTWNMYDDMYSVTLEKKVLDDENDEYIVRTTYTANPIDSKVKPCQYVDMAFEATPDDGSATSQVIVRVYTSPVVVHVDYDDGQYHVNTFGNYSIPNMQFAFKVNGMLYNTIRWVKKGKGLHDDDIMESMIGKSYDGSPMALNMYYENWSTYSDTPMNTLMYNMPFTNYFDVSNWESGSVVHDAYINLTYCIKDASTGTYCPDVPLLFTDNRNPDSNGLVTVTSSPKAMLTTRSLSGGNLSSTANTAVNTVPDLTAGVVGTWTGPCKRVPIATLYNTSQIQDSQNSYYYVKCGYQQTKAAL